MYCMIWLGIMLREALDSVVRSNIKEFCFSASMFGTKVVQNEMKVPILGFLLKNRKIQIFTKVKFVFDLEELG